jgi:hypothetical protein
MFLVILGGAFLVAGLAVLGLIAAGTAPGALAVMAVIFVLVGLLNGGIGVTMLRSGRHRKQLLTTGIAGTATVREVHQTSVRVNDQPLLSMTLDVQLPGREPYQVKKRQVVQYLGLSGMYPGATFAVRVNPAKLTDLEIDWAAPAAGRTIAGDRGQARAAALTFLSAGLASVQDSPQVNANQPNPNELNLPTLPPHMANMTAEEQRENVRELGAPGRAIVDAVSIVGPVGDKMGYRLGMWVQLDSGPSFRVDNGPATVETQFSAKVLPGVTVPLRMAHVRPGVTMTVLEWDRV